MKAFCIVSLSIVALFRRQMSCNSVYVEGEGEGPRDKAEQQNCGNNCLSVEGRDLHNVNRSSCEHSTECELCSDESRKSKHLPRRKYNDSHLIGLPPDAQIEIASYLHPQDVLTLSCANHSTQALISGNDQQLNSTSTLMWFTLWNRDYG